jgi:hypothetical protein
MNLERSHVERLKALVTLLRMVKRVVLACDTFQQVGEIYSEPASVADVQILQQVQEQLKSLENWFSGKKKVAPVTQGRLQKPRSAGLGAAEAHRQPDTKILM